jgi:hypothetical protein
VFYDDQSGAPRLYAVAACPIDAKEEPCWRPPILIKACRNRALSELGKVVGTTSEQQSEEAASTTSTATIRRAEVNVGWYDGDKTIYALAEQSVSMDLVNAKSVAPLAPSGGVPLTRLESDVRSGARAHLDALGVCKDPYHRMEIKCCGGAETFCSDKSRFDAELPHGKCRCGESKPCLFDFKCSIKAGKSKCVCQGKKCPCDILNCKVGQTCGDGRCF